MERVALVASRCLRGELALTRSTAKRARRNPPHTTRRWRSLWGMARSRQCNDYGRIPGQLLDGTTRSQPGMDGMKTGTPSIERARHDPLHTTRRWRSTWSITAGWCSLATEHLLRDLAAELCVTLLSRARVPSVTEVLDAQMTTRPANSVIFLVVYCVVVYEVDCHLC